MTTAEKLAGGRLAWAIRAQPGLDRRRWRSAKSILDQTFELPDEQVFALGREAQAICYTTAEHQESVAAFLNKKSR